MFFFVFFFLSNSAIGCKWFHLHADTVAVCVAVLSFEVFTVLEWSSFGTWVQMPVYQASGGEVGTVEREKKYPMLAYDT